MPAAFFVDIAHHRQMINDTNCLSERVLDAMSPSSLPLVPFRHLRRLCRPRLPAYTLNTLRCSPNTPPGRAPSIPSLRQPEHSNARGVHRPAEGFCVFPAACTFAGLGGDLRFPRGSVSTIPGKKGSTRQHRVPFAHRVWGEQRSVCAHANVNQCVSPQRLRTMMNAIVLVSVCSLPPNQLSS